METGVQNATADEPKVFAMSLPKSMCNAQQAQSYLLLQFVVIQSKL